MQLLNKLINKMSDNGPEDNSADIIKDESGNSQDSFNKDLEKNMKNTRKVRRRYLTVLSVPIQPTEISIKRIKRWTLRNK